MISGKNVCGRARPFIFYDSYVYPSLFGVNDRQLYRSFYVSFFKASGNIHGFHAISPTIMPSLKTFSCATLRLEILFCGWLLKNIEPFRSVFMDRMGSLTILSQVPDTLL